MFKNNLLCLAVTKPFFYYLFLLYIIIVNCLAAQLVHQYLGILILLIKK